MTINKKLDENFMKETMDMRRFFLCLLKKWWLIVIALVLGAVLGAGVYKIYYAITDSQPKYQIGDDYYIVFNLDDYPNGMDYYNAYTWGQFVIDDKIVDNALKCISDTSITKQEIRDSVSSKMASDYRVLTVIVTNPDKDKMYAISEAYKTAMPQFVNCVNELTSIELWSCGDVAIANIHDKGLNAAILGAIIAAIIIGFVVLVYYCMDDRIYVENDWYRNISEIPFIGYDTEKYAKDTEANIKAIVKEAKVVQCETIDDYNDAEADGVILKVPMGKKHATAVAYDLGMFAKQKIKVYGAVLTECDETYLKCYYGRK